MIPYATFLYFALSLYLLLPTLALRLLGKLSRFWILLATVAALLVQYSTNLQIVPGTAVRAFWVVAGYAVLELAVASVFLRVRTRGASRPAFYTALFLGLLPLAIAKWLPLIAPNSLLGFVGISYITFRSLDVIFGIQDRLIKTLPPTEFLGYLFFFPTISSGPIDRYRRFVGDWNHIRSREALLQDLNSAVHHVFTGFLYKFILAALIKQYWTDPTANDLSWAGMLSYMYGYSLYLFFDFAGYSAFAVGFSHLFGIHTPENFDKPFLAANIRDFWNRWHISLSMWFRDHVYMRFVLVATKGKWFKSRHTASHLGLVLSFGLMGLWHGTALQYIIYGFYHAALLVGYDIFTRWNKQRKLFRNGPLWRTVSIVLTFHLICFGFLIFSGYLF